MSHINNDVMAKFNGEIVSKFEKSTPYEDDGNVGGLNVTPYLITPLLPFKVSLVMESCVTSMLNPKIWVVELVTLNILTLTKKSLTSTKTFHKVNKTWAHYEHNKCGLPTLNLLSTPQTMG
jgi:hypothetical protein